MLQLQLHRGLCSCSCNYNTLQNCPWSFGVHIPVQRIRSRHESPGCCPTQKRAHRVFGHCSIMLGWLARPKSHPTAKPAPARVEQFLAQERSQAREAPRGRSERTCCYTPCDLLPAVRSNTPSTMQSALTRQVNKASAGVRSAPRVAKARRWGGWPQAGEDAAWAGQNRQMLDGWSQQLSVPCKWHRSDVVYGCCRCPASPWCAVLTVSSAPQPTWCVPQAGAADVEFSGSSPCCTASLAEQLLAEARRHSS